MKKKQNIFITIIIALVVVVMLLGLLVPKLLLHALVQKALPYCQPVEYATEYTMREENVIRVGNDYFSIEVPADMTEQKKYEEMNVIVYSVSGQSKNYLIYKEIEDMSVSLVDEKYYEGNTLRLFGPEAVEKSYEKLGFDRPDSFYHIMKTAYLLDAKDYNFWSLENQLVYATAGTVRAELMDGGGDWLYERDGVRAIVNQLDKSYMVSVMKEEDLNTVYSIYMMKAMPEDVWKVLNSLEFY